ncbi:MAG: hypothetical protein KatS3mg015_2550 [Fimbriimonadales bacterium]|nr:MAG: hypothetical protein KatS3mg015_2550 [Fimbriimonadales bacterium]
MTSLAFVVPAYRRFDLSRVCLRQLLRTCEALAEHGIEATAVVVGDDANIDLARMLGFKTLRRENRPLGRKVNDVIEYAASPRYLGCEYVVPIGTDNWVDHELIVAQMPPEDGMIGAHRLFFMVHESGERSCAMKITYEAGDGVRTIPSSLLEPLAYRPAIENLDRAIDTSIWERLERVYGERPRCHYVDLHPAQVVGFQSVEEQLNSYGALRSAYGIGEEGRDHWELLSKHYPIEAIEEVQEVYRRREPIRLPVQLPTLDHARK